MSANFVHLHTHTEDSFLDGAIKIKAWSRRLKSLECLHWLLLIMVECLVQLNFTKPASLPV